jgi:hypothetical protein
MNADEWVDQADHHSYRERLEIWKRELPTCQIFRSTVLPTPFPAHSETMLPAFVGVEADVRARGHDAELSPRQAFLCVPNSVSKCWQDSSGRAWSMSAAS